MIETNNHANADEFPRPCIFVINNAFQEIISTSKNDCMLCL